MKAGSSEYKKGLWTVEEDRILMDYIKVHGKGKWNHIAKVTGLKRCGKSCRLRWINYLSPSVKRDDFSQEEDDLIIRLHKLLGNRWSLIAGRVPGRTDNQVKNHWNTHLSKRLGVGKGKCKFSNASSSLNSESRSISNTPSTSNDTPNPLTNDGAMCQNTMEDGTKSEMELTSTQGVVSDWDQSSFLFLDDYPNLYSPNLMQPLDHESFDFVLFDL